MPEPNFVQRNALEVNKEEAQQKVSEASNTFNTKLFEQIGRKTNSNIILSPFSVEMVMGMVLSGAKGETDKQIRSGSSLPNNEYLLPGFNNILNAMNIAGNTNFTLQAANRLYIRNDLTVLSSFLETNRKYYMAVPEQIDFKNEEVARGQINSWVEEQTKNKIKDLIPEGLITPNTALVLVNALYFKGDWDNKFDNSSTYKQKFYTSDRKTIQVDM